MSDENYYRYTVVHAYYRLYMRIIVVISTPAPSPVPPLVPARTALAPCSAAPAPTVYPAGTFKFEAPKDDDDDDDE